MSQNSSNVLSAPQVYRSANVVLVTKNEIHCEITEHSKTTWTILKIEDHPRAIAIDVPIGEIRRTQFHTVNDTSELVLRGRFLPYGFYEIRAHVEMRGVADVFGSDSIFVQVVQTPWLMAAVNDGSYHSVPFGLVVRGNFSFMIPIDNRSTNFALFLSEIIS